MKTNHEAVINSIKQAMRSCKEDSSLEGVKRQLAEVLRLTEAVGKKRNTRESQAKFYAEEAKKNNERWMEMLKNNLRLQLPEEHNDEE